VRIIDRSNLVIQSTLWFNSYTISFCSKL
jgi:hypothetical protein